MTPDELETLVLETDDAWRLQAAFAPLDEKERAALSTAAQKLFSQLLKSKANAGASDRLKRVLARRHGERLQHWNARETRRAVLALFGLCPVSVLKKRDAYVGHEEWPVRDRIVRDRRPEWLDDWIEHQLGQEFSQVDFETLRGWIRDGVCRKPTVDGYYRMFAAHLMRTGFYHHEKKVPPITVQLLADPGLLDDIEGLFRVEHIGFNTNSWLQKGASGDYESWPDALVKLAAGGHLDRDRLLALALEGLTLDLKQNQLSGFHGLYKRLAPTPEERLRHQQDYVALLCHPVGHVAKFAIEMLADLEKQGALDTAPVLREIQTVFTSEGKGNAIAALKLIKRIIAGRDGSGPAPFDAVCEALRHVHADVQAQALDIIEAHPGRLSEAQLGSLRDLESFVSASNRGRVSALLSAVAGTGGTAAAAAAPPARQETSSYRPISDEINDHAVLSADTAIAPIASVEALIDALFHAVEVVESPDEIERIVAAMSRLAGDRPADFKARVSPLLHRLKTGRTGGNSLVIGYAGVGGAVRDLLYTWLTGTLHCTPDENYAYYVPDDAFAPLVQHLRAIAERVARGQARPLLAAPTHKGGWIDPLVWIERLRAVEQPDGIAETMDFRLSLLRLAPDHRAAALAGAATLDPSVRRLAQFALGGDERPAKPDRRTYAAWLTAARCRSPRRDWSAEFAPLELDDPWPDGIRPARYDWRSFHELGQFENQRWKTPRLEISIGCGGEPGPEEKARGPLGRLLQSVSGRIATDWAALPAAALNRQPRKEHYWSGDLNVGWAAQWLAYIWPQNPSAAHLRGALKLIWRMDENASSWEPTSGFFQALFQPNRPWLEPGHLLLALGLVGKDADAKGLAVDALIEGMDGRLFDPRSFAQVMTGLDRGEWLKFNRLGESLMRVLQVSALHAAIVSDALQQWLPRLDLRQKNAFHVLEVLVEAQAVANRPLGAEAADALRRFDGGGKAARLAKQLLR